MFDRKRRIKRGWMKLKVSKILQDTHDTKTIILNDLEEGGRAFDYYAGQYLTFRLDGLSEKTLVRSYTMSSSPKEKDHIAITVKQVDPGFASRYLCKELKVGDILLARGPIGRFVFDPDKDHKHLVMIAGGSGVTPFLSILQEHSHLLTESSFLQQMTLLVNFKTKKDLIAWDLLQELKTKPGINILVSLSREQEKFQDCLLGRIEESLIIQAVNHDFSNKTFMTCGPEPLMTTVKSILTRNNVHANCIKTESFVN